MAIPNGETEIPIDENYTEEAYQDQDLAQEVQQNENVPATRPSPGLLPSRRKRIYIGTILTLFLVIFITIMGTVQSSQGSTSRESTDITPSPTPIDPKQYSNIISVYFPAGDYTNTINNEYKVVSIFPNLIEDSLSRLSIELNSVNISVLEIRPGSVIIDVEIVSENDFMQQYQAKSLQESLEQSFMLSYLGTNENNLEIMTYLGARANVYLERFIAPTASPVTITESPSNSPTTLSPTASGPTTSFPTEFPTTLTPTTPIPTNFPTVDPTTNPTGFPTKTPTKQPSTSPTKNPTEFPTPNPVSLITEAEYDCEALDSIYDVFFLNILQDNNLGDVYHDTDGYLSSLFKEEVEKVLKHKATNFRSAHPNERFSQLGLLFGKYPHEGLSSMFTTTDSKFNLVSLMKSCGYTTSLFGLWHESISSLGALDLDHTFLSSDPVVVKEELLRYISANQVFEYGTKHLLLVWWPKADIYNDIGGIYSEVYNDVNNNVYGVSGVSDRFGEVCKDIVREDDESFYRLLTDRTRRYDVCARQMQIVNQKILLECLGAVNEVITKSATEVNSFVALTSANGPESYTIDPTQESKSSFRGTKSSLYEGGIKVPFYYNSYIHRRPISFDYYELHKTNSLEAESSMNAVDLLPTILRLAGISTNFVLDTYFDGEYIFDYLKNEQQESINRQTMQIYQQELVALDSCKTNSPNFAIIDNYGRYKLLVEPPKGKKELPMSIEDVEVVELYDLEYSVFESVNWYNTKATSLTFSTNVNLVAETLYSVLRKTVKDNQFISETMDSNSGCSDVFNTEDLPEPEVTVPESVKKEVKGIIVILADDMGQSDASIYGKLEKNYRGKNNSFFMTDTPNIDRIGEQGGYVFTDFYSNAAVCSPSRAALLTAKYPSHAFNRIHSAIPQDDASAASKGVASYLGEDREAEHFSMHTFFKSQGYVTGHFGKWHLGFNGPTVDDPMYGIDQYQVYSSNDFPDDKKTVNFPTSRDPNKFHSTEFDNADLFFPSESSNLIIDRTIEFIEERERFDEKFVVNVWLQNAHAPLNLAEDVDEISKYNYTLAKNERNSNARTLEEGKLETGLEVYRALLASQDASIGKLLDYLESSSLLDNTAIFYTSDNGQESTDKYFHSVGNTFSHYRGYKRSLYEGGLRVPGLFRFGDFEKDADPSIISTPASLIDIFPTVVSLTGLSTELQSELNEKAASSAYSASTHELQGHDLSCLLTGVTNCLTEDSIDEQAIVFEWRETNSGGDCLGWSARFALRYKNYKLHLEPSDVDRRILRSNRNLDSEYSRIELYDVVQDPAEMTNLWLTQRANLNIISLVEQLVEYLAEFTQREAYDTTLFPSNRKENIDYSTGDFPVGYLCDPDLVTDVQETGFLPWISTSYLSNFVSQ